MPSVAFTLNGRRVDIEFEEGERLLSILRERLGFTSIKDGCAPEGIGICFSTPSSVPRKPNLNPPQKLPFETSASSSAPHPRTTSRIALGKAPGNPFNPDSGHTSTRNPHP
jgi:hypothetical protein